MKVRGKRALLNKPGFHSTGAVIAEVQDTSGWKLGCDADGKPLTKSSWIEPDVMLQIANCDRSIAFDVDFESADERKNSLHKVDTLISALQAFREGLIEEQKLFVQREVLKRKRKG